MAKKPMFKIILIAVPVVILALLIVIAMQPREYRVSRTATMAALPEVIFPHVNELRQWEPWSPWIKLDPNARNTFEGPASGKGAAMSWAGNNQVGEGRMTITDCRPYELIHFHLEFFKPMAGTSEAEFVFKPEGGRTVVTWTMSGQNNFLGKAMCLVMNMDKMVGGQFEQGLANLKAIVEAPAKK